MQMTTLTIQYPIGKCELFAGSMTAPATSLASVGWIYFNQLSASFCRFARQLVKEVTPGRVCYRLSQTVIVNHSVDVQILNRYQTVSVNNLTAVLVGEVVTSPANPFVNAAILLYERGGVQGWPVRHSLV